MKQKLTFLFALFFVIANAQTKVKNNIAYQGGTISYQQYAPNIFKITFQPKDYTSNQNFTDAVILKPTSIVKSFLKQKGDTISIGNLRLIKASQNNEYHSLSFLLNDDEKIFGGGERALPLNRRGYRINLYNNPWYGYGEGADNLNFSVPFFTSSKGYGLFFDNGSKGYADIGKSINNIFEAGFLSGEINFFVILGKDYKEILTSYQKLTGTQPLPPRWALGNFMSRFGYTSETQVKDIAAKMKAEKIPFDAIIFDLFWFGDSIKGTLGNLDWMNKTKWPHPQQMITDFKKQNINTILITEPFFLQHTKMFDASQKYLATDSAGKPFIIQDFYFGLGGLLDVFRKDAQQWIWNDHYEKQIGNGVAGWWTDLGEPEKHPSAMMHNLKDEGAKRLMKADEVHNIYGHYWNKMLYENYAKDYPNVRLFHLNRSGFAGSQRYSIFPWSGDVSRSWSGFRAQLQIMLGMSMSGIPYTHADAGGFAGGDGDKELYVRWLQFASFTPIFRPHGTALYEVDPNAFSFPSEPALMDEPYKQAAKQVIKHRYQMLPYNYTLSYRQAKYGEPLVRPMYYQFTNDTTAVKIEDEFMWGDEMLVAPILHKNATTRKIYLPKDKWYDATDKKFYTGNQWIDYEVNLFKIPYFIKEGSFVPMYQGEGNTKEVVNGKMLLLYVPSKNKSSYELYEDDGESKNAISQKQFSLTHFISSGLVNDKISISINSNNGNYKNKLAAKEYQIVIPSITNFSKLLLNGVSLKNNNKAENAHSSDNWVKMDTSNNQLTINVLFVGKPTIIEVDF
ncbi:MAG: glycoside hydrolase family 31 protein [Bacteroidota bacterium]|nr:glycoside hydrolase family 31 protein [Bacteroidota bacterium]